MQYLLFLFFMIIPITSFATLTAKYVPNVKSVGPPASLQNGDIYDTGSPGSPGLVGIGTTNPFAILSVADTNSNNIEFTPASSPSIQTYNRNTSSYLSLSFNSSSYLFGIAGAGGGNVGIGSSIPVGVLDVEGTVYPTTFYAAVPSSGTNKNVGIGSFSPGQKLDVTGTIRASLGIVNLAGTTGAVICLDANHNLGHCTAGASCTNTCTCTCAAN